MANLTRKQIEDSIKCDANQMACYNCSCTNKEGYCIFSDNIEQTALAFLDMLERCASEEAIVCPICGSEVHLYGHTDDCELSNLLKEVEG